MIDDKIAKVESIDLINKYLVLLYGKKPFYKKSDYFKAKKCALISVNEMIKILPYGNSGIRFYLDALEKEIIAYEKET